MVGHGRGRSGQGDRYSKYLPNHVQVIDSLHRRFQNSFPHVKDSSVHYSDLFGTSWLRIGPRDHPPAGRAGPLQGWRKPHVELLSFFPPALQLTLPKLTHKPQCACTCINNEAQLMMKTTRSLRDRPRRAARIRIDVIRECRKPAEVCNAFPSERVCGMKESVLVPIWYNECKRT